MSGTPLVIESRAMAAPRPRLAARFGSFTAIACVFVASVSLLVLAGWALNFEGLKTLLYRSPVGMNPLTALLFLMCVVTLWLKREEEPSARKPARRTATAIAAIAAVLAALVVMGQLGGWDVHADEWLFRDQLAVRPGRNRMAPNTAMNFLLVGLALLLLDAETAKGRRPAQLLILIATSVSFLALVGYFLAVLAFYHVPSRVPMAMNTALCFAVLCLGALCARLGREPMATIVSATAGGIMARRLLPAAFGVPLLLGWLRARGEDAGYYSGPMGLSLFALGNIIAFNLLVWWTARLLYRMDERRRVAEQQLQQQNVLLEQAAVAERQANRALKEAQSQLVQSEKLAGLGQMVAGVAHEINNPLAFVTNNIAVLQRDLVAIRELVTHYQELARVTAAISGPDHGSLLTTIDELAERMDLSYTLENLPGLIDSSREGLKRIRRIVEDLRNFARLDESDLKEADVNEGVRSTSPMVAPRAQQKGVHVELDLSPLPSMACYPAKLNQVVMNLLINAIDASPAGGTVVVRTRPEGDGVRIDVVDHGCGIDPSIRHRIFDPFFTTKPIGQGTGLGLNISYRIVKEHGGTIEVDSTPGAGSCFTVHLPRK